MKHSWRKFELIISGIQICVGLMMLFVVSKTFIEYYYVLWTNPLMEHKSIIEMAIRHNSSLIIVAIVAISSGILLIKNELKGYIMGIITWIMFTLLLVINSFRLYHRKPFELGLASIATISLTTIFFVVIFILLNNSEFRIKYMLSKKHWIVIIITVTVITASKFV